MSAVSVLIDMTDEVKELYELHDAGAGKAIASAFLAKLHEKWTFKFRYNGTGSSSFGQIVFITPYSKHEGKLKLWVEVCA